MVPMWIVLSWWNFSSDILYTFMVSLQSWFWYSLICEFMFQNTKNIKTVNLKLILKRWDSQSDTWEKQKNFSSSRRMIWYLAPPWLWIHSIVGYQERRERGLSVRDISFCSSLATIWKRGTDHHCWSWRWMRWLCWWRTIDLNCGDSYWIDS